MTRTEIRTFLQTGVNSLTPATIFGSGLISDFNAKLSETYPSVWQAIKPVNPDIPPNTLPQDKWEIELHIAQKDLVDSSPETYEAIIDSADRIAQKLTYKFNQIVSGYKLVTLEGVKREPFVKRHATCLTGVIMSFTLNAPDKTTDCVD